MKCEYCEIIAGRSKAEIIYEDDEVVAAVKDLVSIPGQITVFPKEHLTIMEMVPDKILKKCSFIANKAGISIFESLGAQGTNIIVQNGTGAGQKVPHFAIEILPRQEGDGLNLQWEAKQLAEDEAEATYMILKEEADKLGDLGKEKKENVKEKKVAGKPAQNGKKEKQEEAVAGEKEEENYMLNSLRRIP